MTIQELRTAGARTGTKVRYQGKEGAISSYSDLNVWVKFDFSVGRLGWDVTCSEPCNPEYLELILENEK